MGWGHVKDRRLRMGWEVDFLEGEGGDPIKKGG